MIYCNHGDGSSTAGCLFAGADIIGINCFYDPDVCLKTMKAMKEALEKAGLKRHLIVQPVGYRTPECLDHNNPASKIGMTGLEEFPFGMKVRITMKNITGNNSNTHLRLSVLIYRKYRRPISAA